MATKNISELTLADALTGDEVLPIVQSGTTKKATPDQLAAVIGTAITASETAAEAAATAASTSATAAATSETAAAASATAASDSAAAAAASAASLGDLDADLLTDAVPRAMSRTNIGGEQNTVVNLPEANKIASYATACHMQGGTAGLPNFIGQQYDFKRVQGDGGAVYVMTFAFPVPDESWSNRITTIHRATNAYTPVTVSSVTGFGTDTLTITFASNISTDYDVFVQVLGADEIAAGDPTSNSRLANILSGYDNVANNLMSVVNGAHNRVAVDAGHGTALGGSNILVLGGSYCTGGGTNVIIGELTPAMVGGTAIGSGLRADGDGVTVFGMGNTVNGGGGFAAGQYNDVGGGSGAVGNTNSVTGVGCWASGFTNTINGNYSSISGLNNSLTANYSLVVGRNNTVTAGDNTFICGQGNSSAFGNGACFGVNGIVRNYGSGVRGFSGAVVGSRQWAQAYSAGQSTSATTVGLTKSGGAALAVGANCAARIRGVVVGRDKNNLEAATFDIDALIMVDAAGAVTIVGGGTNTLKFNTAGLAGVTSTLLAGSFGVSVRVTGLASTTVNWVAVADIVEISTDAQ